jgi:transcriptional regulator with XRE-family HTH domain
MSVIDRIAILAEKKGISQAFICKQLGVQRNWVSTARRQQSNVSDERIATIAVILGTSVAYLKGETDDPSLEKEKSPSEVDELSDDEKIVMYMYRSITTLDEKKAFISDLMKRIPSELSAEVVSLALTALNTSKEQR